MVRMAIRLMLGGLTVLVLAHAAHGPHASPGDSPVMMAGCPVSQS
jgi:hypothetical protein